VIVDMQRRVADQARLFMQFVAALHIDDQQLFDRNPHLAASAERMLQQFDGLLRASAQCDQHHDGTPVAADVIDPDTTQRHYRELVERIRVKVTAVVPVGSIVAIVSRGDNPLLQLPGLTGWHFPRNELGVWAGFHPADDQHAIDLVTDVRAEGAQYLLIPATGFWWLEFYKPLHHYLRTECTVVAEDEDLVLFAFPTGGRVEAPLNATRTYERQRVQFTRFATALLPGGSVVAVVARGDAALLELGSLRARHFPADGEGTYSGTPGSDSEALAALDGAIAGGAEYLAVPHTMQWWLAMYPLLHERLLTDHRHIAERCEAGSIYHLSAAHQKETS
jgi:hypothetical protein